MQTFFLEIDNFHFWIEPFSQKKDRCSTRISKITNWSCWALLVIWLTSTVNCSWGFFNKKNAMKLVEPILESPIKIYYLLVINEMIDDLTTVCSNVTGGCGFIDAS